jgi:hypothetical protein
MRGISAAAGALARVKAVLVWLTIAVVLATAGCGRRDPITFAAVEGRVTVAGRPLAAGEAEITFMPDVARGTRGPISVGAIQSGGTYVLIGPGGRRGAVVGHHKVFLAVPNAGGAIPPRFQAAATSPLCAEVRPVGTNALDFNCENEVP